MKCSSDPNVFGVLTRQGSGNRLIVIASSSILGIKSLAVRCYPTGPHDGRYTTAGIPAALLHHESLQCLIIDATSTVEIKGKSVSPGGAASKLKLLAITVDLSSTDVQGLIASAPQLQNLCLRCSPLSQMCNYTKQTCMSLDLGKLVDLRASELGFPHLQTKFVGLEQLHKLSAVLLCGQSGSQLPLLPKALTDASEEPFPELAQGRMIAKRATVVGTKEKYMISECMSLQHSVLIIEPKWVVKLSDSIIHSE